MIARSWMPRRDYAGTYDDHWNDKRYNHWHDECHHERYLW